MSNLNKVIIEGRLARDLDLASTGSGLMIGKTAIANNLYLGKEKKDEASFFELVFFGRTAEIVAQNFKKGNAITIEGRLRQRSWLDKDNKKQYRIEINVEQFYFPQGNSNNGASNQNRSQPSNPAEPKPKKEPVQQNSDDYDDYDYGYASDLPF